MIAKKKIVNFLCFSGAALYGACAHVIFFENGSPQLAQLTFYGAKSNPILPGGEILKCELPEMP